MDRRGIVVFEEDQFFESLRSLKFDVTRNDGGNNIRRRFALLRYLYGKPIEIIGLKAPGNYSDQFWSNHFRFYYRRDQNLKFHDVLIIEPLGTPYVWI